MENVFSPLHFALFRSPLLPFEKITGLLNGTTYTTTAELIAAIKQLFTDPVLKESLFLSSPTLLEQLERWHAGEVKDEEKIALSLLKYFSRMAYRCTPFGLFAGVSLCDLGDHTSIRLEDRHAYYKHSRLDMGYLGMILSEVNRMPELRHHLTYYPNNTLYRVGEKMRYVECRIRDNQRNHYLVNIDHSEYLQKLIERAQKGATISELVDLLTDDEITQEEAAGFIREVIDNGVLISELEPTVTGKEYMYRLAELLQQYEPSQQSGNRLAEVTEQIREIDATPLGSALDKYYRVAEALKPLNVEVDISRLFQVDMVKPTVHQKLNTRIADELQKTIELLARLNPQKEVPELKKFAEVFRERYDQQEVPLVEVLDSEMGIGFPVLQEESDASPLLYTLAGAQKESTPSAYPFGTWEKFLLAKYVEVRTAGRNEIQLTEEELARHIKNEKTALPLSFYAMGSVLASSEEAIDAGDFRLYYESAGGPSAGNLLGRFCHADERLSELIASALQQEQAANPDVILAEIVHLPEARTGNVLLRPLLRNYEIPIYSPSVLDDSNVILLSDLMVSVAGNRVVLRSRRLGKEVIPRLTSAHNFKLDPLPQYHFLCALQSQDSSSITFWNWSTLNTLPNLPRVTLGKVIVSKARWTMTAEALSVTANTTEETFRAKLEQYRSEEQLPEWVTLVLGDNKLLLNINNPLCIKILLQELKQPRPLILEETLFTEDNLFIRNSEGSFTNEFIIPFKTQKQAVIMSAPQPQTDTRRRLLPGSECLYVKIYCGTKTADHLLTSIIKPLTEQWIEEGIIDKWFFIRYHDPNAHLRLRFFGKEDFYGTVMGQLHEALEPFVEAKLVWKMQQDTYEREIERYGAGNMERSEALFYHDSAATVSVLDLLDGDAGDEVRWLFAIKGTDMLLDDMGFDLHQKKTIMEHLGRSFARKFKFDDKEGKKSLSNKYREHRAAMEELLLELLPDEHDYWSMIEIFQQRSEYTRPLFEALREEIRNGEPLPRLENLAGSYVHMFINRFFKARQRTYELVIYDLLHQFYRSTLSRKGA